MTGRLSVPPHPPESNRMCKYSHDLIFINEFTLLHVPLYQKRIVMLCCLGKETVSCFKVYFILEAVDGFLKKGEEKYILL